MDSKPFDTNLEKYRKPLKVTDYVWKSYPSDLAKPLTEEQKAELAAREANAGVNKTEYDAETAANPARFAPQSENNTMFETNVAGLPDEAIKPRIEYITHLIQSGEADKFSFQAGNGDQTTTSIHQFLYWLQQRAQELENDGTYSPDMFN